MGPKDPRFTVHNVTVQNLPSSYRAPVRQLTHGTKYVRFVQGLPMVARHGKRRKGM